MLSTEICDLTEYWGLLWVLCVCDLTEYWGLLLVLWVLERVYCILFGGMYFLRTNMITLEWNGPNKTKITQKNTLTQKGMSVLNRNIEH